MISITTTNNSGIYTLVAPTPGDYRIRVLLPASAFFSPANQGLDDTKDSDINPDGINAGFTHIISIASNVISITSLDAGLMNVVPSPTPQATATPTPTTIAGTPTLNSTQQAGGNHKIYLPGIQN